MERQISTGHTPYMRDHSFPDFPAPRHSQAYDEIRRVCVLFSGVPEWEWWTIMIGGMVSAGDRALVREQLEGM